MLFGWHGEEGNTDSNLPELGYIYSSGFSLVLLKAIFHPTFSILCTRYMTKAAVPSCDVCLSLCFCHEVGVQLQRFSVVNLSIKVVCCYHLIGKYCRCESGCENRGELQKKYIRCEANKINSSMMYLSPGIRPPSGDVRNSCRP